MNRTKLCALALLVTLPLSGCLNRADEAAAQDQSPPPAASAAAQAGELDASRTPSEIPAERKLIQNAELHVEVESYAGARSEIDALLKTHGGYVADARVEHVDGEVSRAELTLRIPAKELGAFLFAAAGQGRVLHENLTSEDITDGYYDVQARLENAKRLEARLLAIMSGEAKSMKDLLEVEREIARVREEIERYEGKLRLWDKQVAMSTVKLSLFSKRIYVAATPPTLGQKVKNTLGESFGALVGLGQGLLLLATLLLPWLLPLALVAFGIRAVVRRVRRARTAPTFAPTTGSAQG